MTRHSLPQRARQQLNRGAVKRSHRRGELLRTLSDLAQDADPLLLHESTELASKPIPPRK